MILERIPGERWSRVLPLWQDQTVAILAGGPSLTAAQFELIERAHSAGVVRVIAINDSYLRAPYADVHYAADAKWHKWHREGIEKPLLGFSAGQVREKWAAFQGQKCSLQGVGEPGNHIHLLRNAAFPHNRTAQISRDPTKLFPGKHGGFQCLNLATLAGSKRILLLGCDAKSGPAGQRHWHGDHPDRSGNEGDIYREIRASFSAVEGELVTLGVSVINCSLESAIETFPKIPLEEAL